jgi:hypothetical protein
MDKPWLLYWNLDFATDAEWENGRLIMKIHS